jgi:HPt (histidine-containing phosphotransfer) domain-containing protein
LRAKLSDELLADIATQDLSLTKRTAHGLKGLCMQFGATHGMELARLLELDVDNIDDAKTVLEKLVVEVGRVEEFIASWKS